jgi:hypothetical protein
MHWLRVRYKASIGMSVLELKILRENHLQLHAPIVRAQWLANVR